MDKFDGFQKLKQVELTDAVATQLRDLISSGRIAPGDRLPSELDLAEKLGVGRSTIREAMRVLSVMGLVSRSRRGTFVRGADGSDHLEALAYARLAKKGQLADLVEARRILEGSLAAFAAERATEDDIARIRATLDTMKQDGLTPGDFAKTDTEFHLAVAEAAQNTVVATMLGVVRDLLMDLIMEAVEADPSIQVRARAFHEDIISAIEQEDKERARSTMERHIEDVATALRNKTGGRK